MSPFWIIYVIIGLIRIKIANDQLSQELPDLSEMSKSDKIFCLTHQVIHYLRILLVSPLYLLDDLLIMIRNSMEKDE